MSQIIASDKISKRGKEMEEHLSSQYLEPWFSKIRRSKNRKTCDRAEKRLKDNISTASQ